MRDTEDTDDLSWMIFCVALVFLLYITGFLEETHWVERYLEVWSIKE